MAQFQIQMHVYIKKIIFSPLAQILDSKSMEDLAREITDVPEVFDVLNAAFVATFGCDLSHISALFTLAYANAGNLSQSCDFTKFFYLNVMKTFMLLSWKHDEFTSG